jgi:hypothetical protein
MIAGTPHSPGKAFISFTEQFLEALAKNDFGAALRGLDQSSPRWSKKTITARIASLTNGASLCSTVGFKDSASPDLEQTPSGYLLRHRLPVGEKWSDAKIIFEFIRKPGTQYFTVNLQEFEV